MPPIRHLGGVAVKRLLDGSDGRGPLLTLPRNAGRQARCTVVSSHSIVTISSRPCFLFCGGKLLKWQRLKTAPLNLGIHEFNGVAQEDNINKLRIT